MVSRKRRRPRPPLDPASLDELALTYVGRFATTRSKLIAYLGRKLRERGWAAESPPDPEAVAERLTSLGYVDDQAYAVSKARTLTGRGFGIRRVNSALRLAGIDEEDREDALELAGAKAVESALRFAERRRFGPYSTREFDRIGQEKALAAMIRAGHGFSLAKAIVSLRPGDRPDIELLAEKALGSR